MCLLFSVFNCCAIIAQGKRLQIYLASRTEGILHRHDPRLHSRYICFFAGKTQVTAYKAVL